MNGFGYYVGKYGFFALAIGGITSLLDSLTPLLQLLALGVGVIIALATAYLKVNEAIDYHKKDKNDDDKKTTPK